MQFLCASCEIDSEDRCQSWLVHLLTPGRDQLSLSHFWQMFVQAGLNKLLGNLFLYLTTATAKKFLLYLTKAFLATVYNCFFYIYNRSHLQLLCRTFNFPFLCGNTLWRIKLIPASSLVLPLIHRHCSCNCFSWVVRLAPLITYCSSSLVQIFPRK